MLLGPFHIGLPRFTFETAEFLIMNFFLVWIEEDMLGI